MARRKRRASAPSSSVMPGLGVDHEQDQVGLRDRPVGLIAPRAPRCRPRRAGTPPCRRARSAGHARPSRARRDRASPRACRARSPPGRRRVGSRGSTSRRSAGRPRRCVGTRAHRRHRPVVGHGSSSGARSRTTARAASSVAPASSSLVSITTAPGAGSCGFVRGVARVPRARAPSRPARRRRPRSAARRSRAQVAAAPAGRASPARRGRRPMRCLDPPSRRRAVAQLSLLPRACRRAPPGDSRPSRPSTRPRRSCSSSAP